jgi:predicted ribosomally synthesized peptide with nif11-like leader
MSEDQLKAFLEAVNADAGLQEKLKGAADLDAFVAMAKDAGFDVSKADWLKHQEIQELSEAELEGVAGGFGLAATVGLPGQCQVQHTGPGRCF